MAELNFVPSEAIARIFYADDGHGGLLKDESGNILFRHRNVLHIHTLPEEEQNLVLGTVQEAANQLISAFDDANAETWMPALGQLRADHPWEQFVDLVIQYYFDRKQDLDGQIAAHGGIGQIMLNLAHEVERRTDAREAEAKRQSFSRPGGTPKKGFGKPGIRALKAREKTLAANVAPVAQMTQQPVPIQPSGGVIVDDGWQRPDGADEDVQIMAPSQAQSTARSTLEAMSGLQDTQRQRASKGKGRSLLDPQATATRVAFDDSQTYAVRCACGVPVSSFLGPGAWPILSEPKDAATLRRDPTKLSKTSRKTSSLLKTEVSKSTTATLLQLIRDVVKSLHRQDKPRHQLFASPARPLLVLSPACRHRREAWALPALLSAAERTQALRFLLQHHRSIRNSTAKCLAKTASLMLRLRLVMVL